STACELKFSKWALTWTPLRFKSALSCPLGSSLSWRITLTLSSPARALRCRARKSGDTFSAFACREYFLSSCEWPPFDRAMTPVTGQLPALRESRSARVVSVVTTNESLSLGCLMSNPSNRENEGQERQRVKHNGR